VAITGVLQWLFVMNLVVAAFNMLPAFPLDGGRVLRALLWWAKGSVRSATRIAGILGQVFGILFMVVGALRVIGFRDASGGWHSDPGGLWMVLIGLFLRAAAAAPYQQLVARQILEGEPVRRFMKPDPISVPRSVPISELVTDYIYRHQVKIYPIVEDGRLLGCVTLEQVKGVPREEWDRLSVGSLMMPCTDENTISPDADAIQALTRMSRSGASRLLVAEDGRLVGVVTARDLMSFLALKMELEPTD
jgi:CBS domain-containing protein